MLSEIAFDHRQCIAHPDGQTVSAGEPLRIQPQDRLQRLTHQRGADGVRRDIRLMPERGECVAAVEDAAAEDAERAVGMPRQRDDLRIEAERPQQAAVCITDADIRLIGRAFAESSADILHDVAQAVSVRCRHDALHDEIAAQIHIMHTQQELCAGALELCGVPVVIGMRVCEEYIFQVGIAKPFLHPAEGLRQAGIDQQIPAGSVQKIAGHIGLRIKADPPGSDDGHIITSVLQYHESIKKRDLSHGGGIHGINESSVSRMLFQLCDLPQQHCHIVR